VKPRGPWMIDLEMRDGVWQKPLHPRRSSLRPAVVAWALYVMACSNAAVMDTSWGVLDRAQIGALFFASSAVLLLPRFGRAAQVVLLLVVLARRPRLRSELRG
jgi:hypothetical protein